MGAWFGNCGGSSCCQRRCCFHAHAQGAHFWCCAGDAKRPFTISRIPVLRRVPRSTPLRRAQAVSPLARVAISFPLPLLSTNALVFLGDYVPSAVDLLRLVTPRHHGATPADRAAAGGGGRAFP